MNSLKGIRDDIEKSTLISKKVLGKIVELIGENTYQLLKNEHSDIMTTTGELAICLRSLEGLEKENEQLKQKIERMKNHENCKHHSQYSRMHTIYADDKIICYKCKNYSLWELAE